MEIKWIGLQNTNEHKKYIWEQNQNDLLLIKQLIKFKGDSYSSGRWLLASILWMTAAGEQHQLFTKIDDKKRHASSYYICPK